MGENITFKSTYILRVFKGDFNPFTPNIIEIDDRNIEYRRRNWYLISVDTNSLNFQNVIGIDIDKHLFGATIKIKSSGDKHILIHGFSKKKANKIKEICSSYISKNSQRGTNEVLADAIAKAVGNNNSTSTSIADELKKLKELQNAGIINEDEFILQKQKIMNQ